MPSNDEYPMLGPESTSIVNEISAISESLDRIVQIWDSARKSQHIPGSLRAVALKIGVQMPDIGRALYSARRNITMGYVDERCCTKGQRAVRDCKDKATKLVELFRDLSAAKNPLGKEGPFNSLIRLGQEYQATKLISGILRDVEKGMISLTDGASRLTMFRPFALMLEQAIEVGSNSVEAPSSPSEGSRSGERLETASQLNDRDINKENCTRKPMEFDDKSRTTSSSSLSLTLPLGTKSGENYASALTKRLRLALESRIPSLESQLDISQPFAAELFSHNDTNFQPSINVEASSRFGRTREYYNNLLPPPSRLDSYIRRPLIPFLPYADKLDEMPEHAVYMYCKPIDRQWIDIDVVKNWISTCDASHRNHCRSSPTDTDMVAKPQFLIDVRYSCLVPAAQHHKYVALSYVWGQCEATSTVLDKVSTFQRKGALTDEAVILPRTVQHAMKLTQLLDETFLWVDRLCIVQDDQSTKQSQLDCMAEIYANSCFTIVAAQGKDADAGLLGIPGVTGPRQYMPSTSLNYENDYEAISIQAIRLMRTKWYSRGWTFQEHLFSRRKILFHDGTVNWECHCAAWYESQQHASIYDHGPCNKQAPSGNLSLDDKSWPDFHRYARLVSLYNERALTFPEDVLKAFAGVTSTLGRVFDGGFICGLPLMFFDAALLWQPYCPLERREAIHSNEAIPSWSWIGWHGDLHSESWRSGYDYVKGNPDELLKLDDSGNEVWEQTTWRTESTVQWLYSKSLQSPRYPVKISSQRYRETGINNKVNLPDGWTRFTREERDFFKHIDIPNQEFWYPIPLRPFTTPLPPDQPQYLHGHTRSCIFELGALFINPEASNCSSCDLLGADGDWVGVLRLNVSSSCRSFKERGTKCSLIELSAGHVKIQQTEAVSFDEWYRPKFPRKCGTYNFYNVLMIEERAGVAYRVALGRVMRSVWDRCAVETDIVLG